MNYVFRMPKFPLLLDSGSELVHAKTRSQFEKRVATLEPRGKQKLTIIDCTAQGFALYPEKMIVAPDILNRRWTKAGIIDLYNQRRMAGAPELGKRSLSNRSLDTIVSEVVELLAGSPQAGSR
mgnify:CR=1 FL=1|jgi:hypothetical protein